MSKTRRTAAIVTVIAALLAPVAVLATSTTEVTIRPEVEGRTAVRSGQAVLVEGRGPAGRLDGARLVGIEADGDEVVEPLGEFAVNGSPTRTTFVRNDDGVITGRIALGCLFADPAVASCNPSEDGVRDVVLELDLHGQTIRTAPVRVDYTHPEIRGYRVVGPQQVLVTLTEPVTHPDVREDPRDYELSDPGAVITGIGGPTPGDCVYAAGEDRRAGDSGCTRVLQLATGLDRDATPEVSYFPAFPRRKYVDGAGNEAFISSDTRARSRAVDGVAPLRPVVERVDGRAPAGDEPTVLGSDATPTVHVGDVREGHLVDLFVDGTLVARRAAGPDGVGFDLEDALADGVHAIEARAHDRALCDPEEPAAGECGNTSEPSRSVMYDLDTVAPTATSVTSPGATVVVELSERLAGEGGEVADWTITRPDGSLGPEVVEVTGVGELRTLRLDAELEGGGVLRHDGGTSPHADPHGNVLAPFTAEIEMVPVPVATLLDTAVQEGAGQLAFVVSLSDPVPHGSEVVVDIAVTAGTAELGTDVELPDELRVTIPAGRTSGELIVAVVDDSLDEVDETLVAEITDAVGAEVVGAGALATILDDDEAPRLVTADVEVTEGDLATVTVSLDAPSGRTVRFDWHTVAGTAGEGWDFVAASGEATIPAGGTAATLTVRTLDDLLDEHAETFQLALDDVAHAQAPVGPATVTLTDDDASPSVRLGDLRVFEGDGGEGGGTIRAVLDAPSGRDIALVWSTRDAQAVAGEDYVDARGELVILAGASTGEIPVTVLGDTVVEGDEGFEVVLLEVLHVEVADDTGAITILDDDRESPDPEGAVPDEDPVGGDPLGALPDAPSDVPAPAPTDDPTDDPTEEPTDDPSSGPSDDPSEDPRRALPRTDDLPGADPSGVVEELPSESPGDDPSGTPGDAPSDDPSDGATEDPGGPPSDGPPATDDLPELGGVPTFPGDTPDDLPADTPSDDPSDDPTDEPGDPSEDPSDDPSTGPPQAPSDDPTVDDPSPDLPGTGELPAAPGDDADDQPTDDPSGDHSPAGSPGDLPTPDQLPEVLGDVLGRDGDELPGGEGGAHDGDDPADPTGDGGDVLGSPGPGALPRTGGGLGALALLAALGGALRRRRD